MKLKFGFVKVRYRRTEEERASAVCHLWVGQFISQPEEAAVGDQRITGRRRLALRVSEGEGKKPEVER